MSKRVHNTYQTALKEKKIIAFDVGHKYIGVATSSLSFLFASPKDVVQWDSNPAIFLEYLEKLMQTYRIHAFVVGHSPDSTNRRMEAALETVLVCMRDTSDAPVYFINERSSTQEADNRLSVLEEETKERKDAIAAQIILERFFEEHANEVL